MKYMRAPLCTYVCVHVSICMYIFNIFKPFAYIYIWEKATQNRCPEVKQVKKISLTSRKVVKGFIVSHHVSDFVYLSIR